MEREMFSLIAERQADYELTVLDGPETGEKALFSDGSIVWRSEAGGFFDGHAIPPEVLRQGVFSLEDRSVYVHPLGGRKRLVICGAGHVALSILRLGKMTDFSVTCIDDRPSFCAQTRTAGADEVICDAFPAALARIEGGGDTYFVIVTRGHRWDQECLRAIADKPHAYIGMMGSRRRVRIVMEALREAGVSGTVLDTVHAPIGLAIGAETPEEIAVSVMAEILQVKAEKGRNNGYPEDILRALADPETCSPASGGSPVMATIVARRGSAPRSVGTKMLIRPDGRTVGTIGGGCVEAEVCRRGQRLARQRGRRAELCRVDLTDDAAAEEGMVCGGTVDVLLEKL